MDGARSLGRDAARTRPQAPPHPPSLHKASPAHGSLAAVLLAAAVFALLSGAPENLAVRALGPDLQNRLALLISVSVASGLFLLSLVAGPGAGRPFIAALRGWPLSLFAGLALASTLWSVSPSATLTAAIQGAAMVMAAVWLAGLAGWASLLRGLAWTCLVLGALSVLVIPFGGLMGEPHPGALRGLWSEKNEAGSVFALGMVASAALGAGRGGRLWLAAVPFHGALIFTAESGTSLLAGAAALAILAAVETARGGPVRALAVLWAGALGALAVGLLLTARLEPVLVAIGEDPSFSGRMNIWPAITDRIAGAPWLGYGYAAFWEDGSALRSALWIDAGFEAANAHNGFLEVWLGTGLAGLLLMLAAFARLLWFGLLKLKQVGTARHALAIAALAGATSLTESILGGPNGLLWLVFVTFAAGSAPASGTPFAFNRTYTQKLQYGNEL